MKIEVSDKLYEEFSQYLEKKFLSSDVSEYVEGLMISELRRRSWPGYEFDPLTGSLNRFKLNQRIRTSTAGEGWNDHSTYEEKFLCIDIYNFKQYVDNHGMEDGDKVLVAIAEKLKSLYSTENVYRFGGDEFVIALGDSEIKALDIPYEVTIKQSIVHVSVSRNQRTRSFINDEIVHLLAKGIVESTIEGNDIRYEKLISA